jgi:hypothetical protein
MQAGRNLPYSSRARPRPPGVIEVCTARVLSYNLFFVSFDSLAIDVSHILAKQDHCPWRRAVKIHQYSREIDICRSLKCEALTPGPRTDLPHNAPWMSVAW